MKILHILNTGRLSGAENVAADICMMFKNDHEMAYCSPEGSISKALMDRKVIFIPIKKLTIKEIKRVINEFEPDLIDAHDVRATVVTALLKGRIPLISHLHVNNDDMRKRTFKSTLYRLAVKRAAQIVAVSDSCLDEFVYKNAITEKTVVLKNVIYSKRLVLLSNMNKNDCCFDFIFLGRLTYQKNPQRIAEVASKVLKIIPTARFGIIGDGDLRNEMEEVFRKEGVINQVVFTGILSYPYNIIKQAKCMIFCSRFEGTPISALEAMYFGVPIVSTPTDGLIELIENGITGYLSENNDQLVDSIVRIIINSELRNELAKNEKEKFNIINNEETYKNTLENIYESALLAGKTRI